MLENSLVLMNPNEVIGEIKKTVKEVVAGALSEVLNKPARVYTRKEVMDIFHISQPTLDSWIRKGLLRPIRQLGRVYFRADEIDAMVVA